MTDLLYMKRHTYSTCHSVGVLLRPVQYIITKTRLCNILQFFMPLKMIIFRQNLLTFFLIFAQNIDFGYTLEPRH